jgi:hypothetical protein
MQRQHCHILILLTIATLAMHACAPRSQTEMDPDEQAIGALVACQGLVVKSVSNSAVATPVQPPVFWTRAALNQAALRANSQRTSAGVL